MAESGNGHIEQVLGLQEIYKDLHEPAAASKRVLDYLIRNPFCDRSVLKSATNLQTSGEKYPEIIHLAGAALDTRTKVANVYSELSLRSGQNQKRIASVLYEAAQGKHPNASKGNLEMGYLDNPFALVIVADEADFKHLNHRDSAGYYNNGLQVEFGNKQFTVPFIAIQSGTSLSKGEILRHENMHANNDLVRQSLDRVRKDQLWGGNSPLYENDANRISTSLVSTWDENSQNPDRQGLIKSNRDWRRMMDYSLSYAKDEIIVRLITGEDTNSITKRHGPYDLQDEVFNLKKDGGVVSYFWTVYTNLIKKEVQVAKKVMNTYSAFDMKEKEELFPWMLQRIPLGSWGIELNKVGISSEVEIIDKIIAAKKSRWFGSHSGFNKLKDGLLGRQDELLVPQLVEYWQSLQK